ncbi:iron complex transport system permease protein [Enterococcus sp. PF1-24]|uniref:iron chelate uptake ABC transporter family permease subunit n=1 Tax=unclassified Enterococcus TaxID=2608891 RepID=UPI00247600C0|nr:MULTISPECIES: iron chelate uptake ABC transporter family permease subunit [unclassified Enterococcus]MDH6363828.1 iron complex transport system permease protein [Enterococcus sp. PFB1-1]MDH6400986.1 iron complex transport system permease protein [Enterococcus sp. PF1-24]
MKKSSLWLKLLPLLVVAAGLIFLYLTYNTYGNWQFALKLRGKKVVALILVAIASSFSTITFQTLTQNHFLTPNILGLDSLYVLVQTLLFFFVGGVTMLSQESLGMFLGNIILMACGSLLLSRWLLAKAQNNLFLLLMVGMISGTLFSSLSTFLQVVMDPNEYDLLQGKLFASFGNVNSYHLLWALGSILLVVVLLFKQRHTLDVLHLGRDQALALGINLSSLQIWLLLAVSLLTGTATALMGPITFLGFVVANVSYQYAATYRHDWLFAIATLLGIIFLVGGQFLVEQVFALRTTLSIVIEFSGGLYFVAKIIRERKKAS